jgi:asparagine synthase (glutamine-hydrolysing)
MCGIAGILELNKNKSVSYKSLKKMSDTIIRRGPDDDGIFINNDKNLGFSFRRLSIIDLKLGQQPMSDQSGNIWIVFNGEIYNHGALRSILKDRGYQFKTKCDTEVIIYAYKEWGEECVHKFRGMFAFSIWDNILKKMFMARDRLGIKPLYFLNVGSRLIFSSEIKAIITIINKNEVLLDEEAFYHYLTLSVTPAPSTMFKNIKKLKPGHTLTISQNGKIKYKKYWNPKKYITNTKNFDQNYIINKLRALLDESIKLRMISDVPFGAFLSGGIDSSLNVALMNKNMDNSVDTFSVSIKNDALSDERSEAKKVSNHFKTNHKEIEISSKDFINVLPEIVKFQDEPLADPVCIPLYFVSKLARENGTYVIQVGEGADEIFAGYGLYGFYNDFNKYYKTFSNFPSLLKSTITGISKYLLPNKKYKYIEYANSNKELFWGGATSFYENEKKNLLKKSYGFDTYENHIKPIYDDYDSYNHNYNFIDRITNLELNHRLPELLLMRVDKMGMANSIETRVPFLDHKLVEFSLSIPSGLKYRNGINKYILKEAARGIIPNDIIDKKKKGFCGSASNMVGYDVIEYAEKLFSESEFFNNNFNVKFVKTLLEHHKNSKVDNGVKIWTLLNFIQWHKEWID